MRKKSAQSLGGRRQCPGGRPSTVKNGREEHPHDLEERGNVLEERQSAVKNCLEEHHPVWDFKISKLEGVWCDHLSPMADSIVLGMCAQTGAHACPRNADLTTLSDVIPLPLLLLAPLCFFSDLFF